MSHTTTPPPGAPTGVPRKDGPGGHHTHLHEDENGDAPNVRVPSGVVPLVCVAVVMGVGVRRAKLVTTTNVHVRGGGALGNITPASIHASAHSPALIPVHTLLISLISHPPPARTVLPRPIRELRIDSCRRNAAVCCETPAFAQNRCRLPHSSMPMDCST